MASPSIPEITLGDLMAEMDAEARRIPIQGTIEPTFRCNLSCVHCYVNEPAGARRRPRRASCSTERAQGAHRRDRGRGLPQPPPDRGRGPGPARFPRDLPATPSPAACASPCSRTARWSRTRSRTSSTGTARLAVEITLYGMTARDLRPRDARARLLRALPAGHRPPARPRHPPQAQDDGPHLERARDPGHAGVRARARAATSSTTACSTRAWTAGPAATASCSSRRRRWWPSTSTIPEQARILKEACDEALAAADRPRPRRRPRLLLRRRAQHLHRRSLRLAPALPALAPQRRSTCARARSTRAGTSTSRACARAPGSPTTCAGAAASSRSARAARARPSWSTATRKRSSPTSAR